MAIQSACQARSRATAPMSSSAKAARAAAMKPFTAACVGAVGGAAPGADDMARGVAHVAGGACLVGIEGVVGRQRGPRRGELLGGLAGGQRVARRTGGQQPERRVAGAQRARLGEGGHEVGVPAGDPLDEPATVGDELAAVHAHVAVELDAPQLVGPATRAGPRRGRRARAGWHAPSPPVASSHSPSAGQAHAGERTDPALAQELVGDHADRPACHSRKIASCRRGRLVGGRGRRRSAARSIVCASGPRSSRSRGRARCGARCPPAPRTRAPSR